MTHLRRQQVPKNWPIKRKGTAYVVRPNFAGVPILIILRDMLKIAENKKEVKRALHENKILLNSKTAKDEKNPAVLFDTISIIPSNKHYRLILDSKGKYILEEIKEKEAGEKIAKIINKKILKGKKVQLNMGDGRNFISQEKCNVNDSILIDFKKKKIEKYLPFKEKAEVIVFAGKHAGKRGVIDKLIKERKIAKLRVDGQEINVLIKQIMVTG
mgnify:CR=1 FL=1